MYLRVTLLHINMHQVLSHMLRHPRSLGEYFSPGLSSGHISLSQLQAQPVLFCCPPVLSWFLVAKKCRKYVIIQVPICENMVASGPLYQAICLTSFCNIFDRHYLHPHVRHKWNFKLEIVCCSCRIHILCIHLHVSPYIVVLIASNPSRLVPEKYRRSDD